MPSGSIVKPLPILTPEEIQEFRKMIDSSGGPHSCWPWMGSRHKRGYGNFWVRGKSYRATRIVLFLRDGVDPLEWKALHSCDNPPCCNDDHLFPGTQADNADDMMKKGRWRPIPFEEHPSHLHPERLPRGVDQHLAKLNDDAVREIRKLAKSGEQTTGQMATRFGVHYDSIRNILYGKTWKHVT